nr:hypothetical protein [uncultured Blautia sp.]
MFYNGQGSSDAVKKSQVTSADICTIKGMAVPYSHRGNPYTGKRHRSSPVCWSIFSLFFVMDKRIRCRSPTVWQVFG